LIVSVRKNYTTLKITKKVIVGSSHLFVIVVSVVLLFCSSKQGMPQVEK